MLNQASIHAINTAGIGANNVRPLYESYCFANLPGTIAHALTGDSAGLAQLPADVFGNLPRQYDTVVLCFIDAFGWRFIEQFSHHPFVQRLIQQGVVSKLTSMFPSTTAAHVTTLNTGLTPAQSGVHEWFYYEPEVDAIIAPLLFSLAQDRGRETLQKLNVDPTRLYPTHTFYQTLGQAGVQAQVFMPNAIIHSTYSKILFDGAQIHGYKTLPEVLTNLRQAILRGKTGEGLRRYFYFYFPEIDTLAHDYGPSSPQVAAQIENFLWAFEHQFVNRLAGKADNTLLMMIADHGQLDTPPEDTYYLNQHLPDIARYLRRNRAGQPILAAGSPRDVFLHVQPHLLDELTHILQHALAGIAEVHTTQDLIQKGYFGPVIAQRFLDRVGNLTILSHPGQSVWWYEKDRENELRGHHGGFDRAEMETPLVMLDLGQLG